MTISSTSSLGSGMNLPLLRDLMGLSPGKSGQKLPVTGGIEDAKGPPAGRPAGPPPTSRRPDSLAADTMSSLLEAQSQRPSTSDVASRLISRSDTDSDGQLSLDEVTKALRAKSSDALTEVFGGLDGDSNGSLSSSELSAALDALLAKRGHAYAKGHRETVATEPAPTVTAPTEVAATETASTPTVAVTV